MASPLSFSVREIDVRVGEAWTRMPFRYGNACLTAVPLLHLELVAEAGPTPSPTVRGVAADCLPPRWFDKDPLKDFRANVDDQLAAIEIAREVYLAVASDQSPASVHELWLRAFPEVITRCAEQRGLNRLTASFGSSLVERAAIDAACRAVRSLSGALKDLIGLERRALNLDDQEREPDRPLDYIPLAERVKRYMQRDGDPDGKVVPLHGPEGDGAT